MAEELTVPPYQRSIGEAYPVGTKPWHGQEPQTMPSRAMVRSRSMERSWREIRITSSASVGWVLRRSSHAGTGTRITTPELLRRNWYYFQISEFRFSSSILPAIFTSFSTRSRHLFRELLSSEPSLVRISLSSKIQHDHGIFLINIRGRRRISFNTNNPTTCHR